MAQREVEKEVELVLERVVVMVEVVLDQYLSKSKNRKSQKFILVLPHINKERKQHNNNTNKTSKPEENQNLQRKKPENKKLLLGFMKRAVQLSEKQGEILKPSKD